MIDTTKLRELAQQAQSTRGYINYIPDALAFQDSANPAAILELLDRLEAAENEQHRLQKCLQLANVNAEYFEREMYLLCYKLEATERDAKRYRHLRDDEDGFDVAVRNDGDEGEYWVHGYPPEELDAAIDAAMQQEQNQ